MRLVLSLKVLVVLGVTSCYTSTTTRPTTTTSTTTKITTTAKAANISTTTSNNLNISSTSQSVEVTTESSSQNEADDFQHIIKHSKLFTEFISFAINPVKTTDIVLDKIKGTLMSDESIAHEIRENKENTTSDSKITPLTANVTPIDVKATSLGANVTVGNNNGTTNINSTSANTDDYITTTIKSNEGLQELFVELMKRSSPGFIVSFDYLEVKKKSLGVEENSRKPVRVWGIVPDEMNNKTTYFLADPYRLQSTETDMKETPQEQIDDFECWKNETLYRLGSDDDDKLGDGTIGSLLGIG